MADVDPGSRATQMDAYPQLTEQRAPTDHADEFGLAVRDRDRTTHTQEFLDQHTAMIRRDPHEFPGLARSDGSFIDTSVVDPASRRTNFVIIRDPGYEAGGGHRLLIASDRTQGHPDLAGGASTKYAGEIATTPWGQVTASNANSGHYLQPDLERGAQGIDANPALSDNEKAAAKAKLAATAPTYDEMRNNKLQEVIDDQAMPERPLTPPLRFETVAAPRPASRADSPASTHPEQPITAQPPASHPPMQPIGLQEPHEAPGAATSGGSGLAKALKGCCGLR